MSNSEFILTCLSAYGFSVVVQMLRGVYLEYKPFNCKICLSFWYALVVFLNFGNNLLKSTFLAFAVVCIIYGMKMVEDRITMYSSEKGNNETDVDKI